MNAAGFELARGARRRRGPSGRCRASARLYYAGSCALWAVLSLAGSARADESSGTWTGSVELRGNYYLERSTRVVMPAGRVSVETPNGLRATASYVLDVIASASIAQTGGAKDGVFTELRHGFGVISIGKKFDARTAELDLSLHSTYSTEDDYKSMTYGFVGSLALDEKNTTITLGLTRVDDTVESNIDSSFEGKFNGLTLGLGVQQLLSPVLKLDLSYQRSHLDGFLGNPYRRALVGARARAGSPRLLGGLPQPESPPDSRWRHNVEAQLSWYLPSTSTAIQPYVRAYADSWDIQAFTFESRVYQRLTQALSLRLRYRFYTQTRADFAPEDGQIAYPVNYDGPLTNDPKMVRFHSNQVGLRFAVENTFLDFLRGSVVDLSIDRGFSSSSFLNYWIASVGGRVPF